MRSSWQRNNAIHSGGDYLPHEETGAVIGEDRFCDECAGKRSHLPGCPVRAEIQQQDKALAARRAAEEKQFWADYRRAVRMSTKKGRSSL